jgi:hypothetical protein
MNTQLVFTMTGLLVCAVPAFGGVVEDQVLAKEKTLWVAFQKRNGDL